ncbi:alpha/beta hydrolase family protein (plasmid) [Pseudoalteromonas sp. T1lg65]|uniref:alpha/beta hydrolase family protein n=1 Tax=Pseudoalteromonas sp. T1lg65 TaxID=2077101 RepID=UPI003F79ED3F
MKLKLAYWTAVTLISCLLINQAVASPSAGIKLKTTEVEFFDTVENRPLKVKLWHQSSDRSCREQVCLPDNQNARKIAVISHGAFGSPHAMNWLGYALASQGWVVAGVAHYQESWVYGPESIDPFVVMRFWQRPQEVNFTIDRLSEQGLFNKPLVTDRVLMLGHSSGGFTTLAMAGAKLEAGKSQKYCTSELGQTDKGCNYGSQRQVAPLSKAQLSQIGEYQTNMRDPRIAALVALDPALGHAVNPSSLREINVPTLIFGSIENDFLPYTVHAKYYADHIKTAQLIGVGQGAGHFVYIDECHSDRKVKGVPLCKDRDGVDRKAIQKQILGQIFGFLNQHMGY